MKTTTSRLRCVLALVTGFLVSSASADFGFQQVLASQGAPAVGQAVLVAARAIYADSAFPAGAQKQLTVILNEVVATENESAIRYSIVAEMMAGGIDNLELSKAAINDSDIFSKYPSLMATTVAETEALLTAVASGIRKDASGGGGSTKSNGGGDAQSEGGGDPNSQGGGSDLLFVLENDPSAQSDVSNPFISGGLTGGGDKDKPATKI